MAPGHFCPLFVHPRLALLRPQEPSLASSCSNPHPQGSPSPQRVIPRVQTSGRGQWQFGKQTLGCLLAGCLLVVIYFSAFLGGRENEHKASRDLHKQERCLHVNQFCQPRHDWHARRAWGASVRGNPALASQRDPWRSMRPDHQALSRGDCGTESGGHSPGSHSPTRAGPVHRAGVPGSGGEAWRGGISG